jgi:hypothetical protein
LQRWRRRYVVSLCVRNAALFATVLFGLLTGLQLVFAFLPWTALPVVWDISILGFLAAILLMVMDKAVVRRPPLSHIAALVERTGRLKPRWVSLALELSAPESPGSTALKEDVVRRAAESLANHRAGISRPISRALIISCAAAALAWGAACIAVKPRLISFWDFPFSLAQKTGARILPGSVTLPLHSSVNLRCLPGTKGNPSCRLVMTTPEGGGMAQSRLLRPDSSGGFGLTCDSIDRSFIYQFSLGATDFAPETIRVVAPPVLQSLRIRLVPPAYVNMPAVLLPEGQGAISAYRGSTAYFSISAPHALSKAAAHFSSGNSVPFAITGNTAHGAVTIKSKGGYTFSLTDTFGQKSDSLPDFFIDLTPDMPPLVQLLKPGADKDLSPAQVETLWVEALDDIGLVQCSLVWRKNSEPRDTTHSRLLLKHGKNEKNFRVEYVWDVNECSLYPGDTVFYWAYARDNNPYDTGHGCVSRTFWFRLPTFEEIHERIVREHSAAENSLSMARGKENSIQETMTDLLKSAKGKESLTWEQKQIVKDLEENFRAQSDTIAHAAQSLKKAIEKLKEQGLSREIVDKMDNIRKELDELVRQYGDSLLFEPLRQNERAVTARDLKDALRKFQKMLPDLSQRLDNALKALEMIKRDRKLAAWAALAEKYGKEQGRLAASGADERQRLQQQKNLSDNVDNLLSELSREADKKNDALFSKGDVASLDQVQSAHEAMNAERSKKNTPAPGMMNQMSAGLLSLSQDLLDLQSSAMMRKLSQDQDVLMDMSHDALSMADWQENIKDDPGEPGAVAQNQQALRQALAKSSEKLNKLSMASPGQLRQFMKQYERAGQSMENSLQLLKNEADASEAMNGGKQDLHGLAYSLMQSAQAISGQGQAGNCDGMTCGLQRLSGKQAMINGLTGELLRRMLGENGMEGEQSGEAEGAGTSGPRMEKARKQAQEAQQSVADELKRLAEKYGKESENSLGNKSKELEEEARRLSKMLENPQPEIRDRQDRFLSRMIQTTISMHKQDEGKDERKSQSSTSLFSIDDRQSGAPMQNDRDTFFRMRQKAFSGNFPENYRYAIKNYFDSLGVLYLREK